MNEMKANVILHSAIIFMIITCIIKFIIVFPLPAHHIPSIDSQGFNNHSYPLLDYRGKIYCIGTSITCGSVYHDCDHSLLGSSDVVSHSYEYWFDYIMLNKYNVRMNTSDWYQNTSYEESWDKYIIGTGGGQNNDDGTTGMRLSNIPSTINNEYGRGVWRWRQTNWRDVSYLIVEGGCHELSEYKSTSVLQEIENALQEIYTQSKQYGYTVVLLASTPCKEEYVPHYLIDGCNKIKESFVQNHPDIVYVDCFNSHLTEIIVPYDLFTSIFTPCSIWFYNNVLFYDGVHPNHNGYQYLGLLIADAIYKDIRSKI